jgi:transcription termination/antitermination protein NusA
MVVGELRGERIDIIPYNDDPARFVAKALSPARVREVIVDDEERSATIVVPDDQLSLAIGKEGQNARLASKLTGWRIDIKSQQQMADAESALEFADDEGVDGQCMAVLRTGKRCPNRAEPNSRYCGIHVDYVEPPAPEAAPADEALGSESEESGAVPAGLDSTSAASAEPGRE